MRDLLVWTQIVMLAGMSAVPSVYADNLRRPIVQPRPIVPPAPIVRPIQPNPIVIQPGDNEIIRGGAARLFVPYSFKDPATGGGSEGRAVQIRPSALLKLPNGKSITAQQYYGEINKYESYFAKEGYSLRDGAQDSTVELQRLKFNHRLLLDQRSRLIGEHLRQGIIRLPSDRNAVDEHQREERDTVDRIRRIRRFPIVRLPHLPEPVAKTFDATRTWDRSWGEAGKFAGFVSASLKLAGNKNETSAQGEGSAGGYIFGKRLNIVKGSAIFKNPEAANQQEGHVNFYFLGLKIYSKDHTGAGLFHSQTWNKGLDESTTIRFSLGPIPMSAKIGARGEASLFFRMGILALRSNVDAKPGVEAKVYIQAGADIIVGGAGAGSDLVLIQDEMELIGRLHLLIDSKGPYYSASLNGYNEISALKGRVYAYAFLYVPRWGIPPWKKKTWEWTLFRMDGIHAAGTFLNYNNKTYLY